MGCEFEINVQVLYGNCWVNILCFGTKTTCYGFPLSEAVGRFAKPTGLKCMYGAEHPILRKDIDFTSLIFEENIPSGNQLYGGPISIFENRLIPKNDSLESSREPGEQTEEQKTNHYIRYLAKTDWEKYVESCTLYFSIPQFMEITKITDKLEQNSAINRAIYSTSMERLIRWSELARSCGEVCSTWLNGEDTDLQVIEFSEEISAGQQKLHQKFTHFLCSIPSDLPHEMMQLIAEYATPPLASDVRVSFYEEEGWLTKFRNETEPCEVGEIVKEKCCIM